MKILIISHNPISTYNNMGKTLLSLFGAFRQEELCQLYVHPSAPDTDLCTSYFRITDREVLNGLIQCKAPGQRIDPICLRREGGAGKGTYQRPGNHTPVKRLLRDVMWRLSRWKGRELLQWLEEEHPTHIFLAPGYAKFIYDVAMELSEIRKIPIITYICDDYYFLDPPRGLAARAQRKLLQKKTDQLMARTQTLVTISEEIKEVYSRHFGVNALVIMTGGSQKPGEQKTRPCQTMSYFGNLGCGRYRSLARVGRGLDQLNRELGTDFSLNVYTGEQDEAILTELRRIPSLCLRGFLTGEAYQRAFEDTDLLLHVEGFEQEDMDTVKYSVSTKIADSLSSGIPLVAYGPGGISSMGHLIRNDCAFTATAPEELDRILLRAFTDPAERRRVSENAHAAALQHHDGQGNSEKLKRIFMITGTDYGTDD